MGVDQALSLGFIDRITGEDQPTNETNQIMSILDKFKAAPDEALVAKVDSLETDLTAALTELQDLQATVSGKDESIANLTNEKEALQNELNELKESSSKALAEADKAVEAAEAKATPEAIQAEVDKQNAKAGVEPAEVVEVTGASPSDDKEFLAKWEKASVSEIHALKTSDPEAFKRLQALTN